MDYKSGITLQRFSAFLIAYFLRNPYMNYK